MSALTIAAALRDEAGFVLTLVGLALLAVIHASTVMLQVPAHRRLSGGYDAEIVHRLVRTNWVRTIGCSLRVAVASAMIITAT